MNKEVKPLYRKVNSKVRGSHHNTGPDAKHDRNTKEGIKRSMKQDKHRGLDFTPLYRFLHSKVGQNFDQVVSEARKRLPEDHYRFEPIYIIVIKPNEPLGDGWCVISENSYMSTMYVDDNGNLQFVNPNLKNEDFSPSCWCCTHTFNGTPLQLKHTFALPPKYPKNNIES